MLHFVAKNLSNTGLREKERESERERNRETEKQRERNKDRDRDKDRKTQRAKLTYKGGRQIAYRLGFS